MGGRSRSARAAATRLDLAWHSIETNQFGLHEFMDWAGKVGTEPMMAVNLGTRGLQDACDLLEYTNHPGGTYWSDRRIANGATDPFGVKLWCLGNEMDGPWQVGHKTAAEYGRLANETGQGDAADRLRDRAGGLRVARTRPCPPSVRGRPRCSSHCYDAVDYISLHAYYEETGDDPLTFLASAVNMDRFIDDVVATADAVRARAGTPSGSTCPSTSGTSGTPSSSAATARSRRIGPGSSTRG